jgi:transcriptional regulator with XRE-family HTH domain
LAKRPRPLFQSREALEAARSEQIRKQLAYEVWHLREERLGYTQPEFAEKVGLSSGAGISRFETGRVLLSKPVADRIDNLSGAKTTIEGLSFSAMRALASGPGRDGRSRRRRRELLFLASPMVSAGGSAAYARERSEAMELANAIETHCDLDVYYAGRQIPTEDQFDLPQAAAGINFPQLRRANYFALLLLNDLKKPSSVWVEAGFALALGLPSVYFVRRLESLPWILHRLTAHDGDPELPPVEIAPVGGIGQAINSVIQDGRHFFTRLEQ